MSAPLLLSVFPSFVIGGAQSRFTTLVNHLGPAWRHAIVSMDNATDARERLDADLDVTFLPLKGGKGSLSANLRSFRAILRDLRPATMLTHNFGSIEWAMANVDGFINHVHVEDGFGPDERATQLPRRVLLRRLFLRRRSVILPSRTLMNIARSTWRLSPRHLHYVPNGVDLERFGGSSAPRTWPGTGPVIGTVAALRPEKNIARLIRAFSLVNARIPARLVIVGDGALRADLETLAGELGIGGRVHFEGHVAKPDQIVRSLDVFAMSSDTEQMPISLLEAMATGRPVVATDVGDIASMLPAVQRRFVTPCDDRTLAEALLAMLGDPLLLHELGQSNRAMACENFSQTSMFRRWSTLLDPLSNAPPADGHS